MNLGLSAVIVILLLVIRGQRQLILDSDRSSIFINSTEPEESSWLILSPPKLEQKAIHPEKSMEEKVEETILEKGSFFLYCFALLTHSHSLFGPPSLVSATFRTGTEPNPSKSHVPIAYLLLFCTVRVLLRALQ